MRFFRLSGIQLSIKEKEPLRRTVGGGGGRGDCDPCESEAAGDSISKCLRTYYGQGTVLAAGIQKYRAQSPEGEPDHSRPTHNDLLRLSARRGAMGKASRGFLKT